MKMSIKKLILFTVTLASILASCIPNKKVAYLQYKNEYKEPATIVKDSLIRKYNTGELAYKLHPSDLLDIKISTMTPLLFNPFNDADRGLMAGQQFTQSGDAIRIVQSTGYYINSDGIINLPVIGKIKVAGFTISEAEDTLAANVQKYLEKPVVRIKLQNFRFTVIGEVETQATLTSGDNNITLLQAVAMAGGPSEFGDMSRVKVLRHSGNNTNIFYVDLLSENFISSPFYFVQPGDVIVITPLKQRSYLKYAGPNLGILTGSISLFIAIISLLR